MPWRLQSAGEGESTVTRAGKPLRTLCDPPLAGRQVWAWVEGSDAEERAHERARAGYAQKRRTKGVRHSADELLRIQMCGEGYEKVERVSRGARRGEAPPSPRHVDESMRGGLAFYSLLQQSDGHWPGDYGGPMFLMPGLIIACRVMGKLGEILSPRHQAEMVRYLRSHQAPDGGYGLHIEGHSTMFGTVLSYVSLRLLGVPRNDPCCQKARAWMLDRGGAVGIPSWGKFWLSVLNVHSWDGLNPVPPEAWLLPYSKLSGIGYMHPGRFWCHCRMVYLPMSYIYGARVTGPEDALCRELRQELYVQPYGQIDWNKARNECASEDLYYPHPVVQDVLWWSFYKLEALLLPGRPLSWLRRWGLREALRHIVYEDENTRYVDIGPVNKVMNMLCRWHAEGPDSEAVALHASRVPDYLWVAEDGMKMQGYNGSQLWDTAFAVQAIFATGMEDEVAGCIAKCARYIDSSQVRSDCPGDLRSYYRHISKGAWPFSTRDHGWPISDCSSEGLKASLAIERHLRAKEPGSSYLEEGRLEDCVNVIMSYQNATGGWATYENTRSVPALELINPAETFGDIVIDYDYVECSSACVTALSAFAQRLDEGGKRAWGACRFARQDLAARVATGADFIASIQRPDGSWYGSWGVCFTYATWFGVEGLRAAQRVLGARSKQARGFEDRIAQAAAFLLDKQRPDGGWGESYLSCEKKVYSQLPEDEGSHVVNTAWAMLALIDARQHEADPAPLHRAAAFLMSAQLACGDWPQQHISGVFNRNCMITYANYRNIFPLWALGRYKSHVLAQA